MMTVLFKPAIMIGVDIDFRLIKSAIKQMHKISSQTEVTKLISENEKGDSIDERKEEENKLIKRLK